MNILEKASKLLTKPLCDHCLGRQFGQLLSGYTNVERGKMIRSMVAMSIDEENTKTDIDLSNFSELKFHNLEVDNCKRKKCYVCDDTFEKSDAMAENVVKLAKNYEFKTFLVGTKLSFDLLEKEEEIWELAGIDYCEPIKSEINREIGKKIEIRSKTKFNPKLPDVNFIIDFNTNAVQIISNPLFIYGEYQKLKRGIPQTKWPTGAYKTSVEQIIAKPYMKTTKGINQKLHGQGREDIDALCLGWRPFVLEIIEPKNRFIDIKKLAKQIGKEVRVRNLHFSGIAEVRKIKEKKSEKSYQAIIETEKEITNKDLEKLKNLIGKIKQKTPSRVLHRRADKIRTRSVIKLKTRLMTKNKFELTTRVEGGLYIKELISGDSGRTAPSVSSILDANCKCIELNVTEVHD